MTVELSNFLYYYKNMLYCYVILTCELYIVISIKNLINFYLKIFISDKKYVM